MKEKWKAVKNYEGLYEISNFGRVRSLSKEWVSGNGGIRKKETTFLKKFLTGKGYPCVKLYNNKKNKTFYIHHLVYDYFGKDIRNGRTLIIDHVDENKTNNRIDNLQLLTQRENISKSYFYNGKKTSEYTGVHWDKERNKWFSQITTNKKRRSLGRFTDEYDAHLAYQRELKLEGII